MIAWPYFGSKTKTTITDKVTGSKPVKLTILGQEFAVESWRDVLEQTLNAIYDLDSEIFDIISANYPNLINGDKDKLRSWRQLKNGKYVETKCLPKYSKLYCIELLAWQI